MDRNRLTVADAKRLGTWTPGWMLDALTELARGHEVVVEVGSWLGRSAMALALGAAGTVYCCDHWQGAQGIGQVENPLALYRQFMANVHAAGVGDKIVPLPMHSVAGATWFRQTEIDLLFIDGDHQYAGVSQDLHAWSPLVKPTGVICGDDYGEVRDAVGAYFGDAKQWDLRVENDRLWVARRNG